MGTDTLDLPNDYSIIVGTKQLRKALCRGEVIKVLLARDADPAITGNLEELCRQHGTAFTWVDTMTDLGHACGIDVGAASAAVAAKSQISKGFSL